MSDLTVAASITRDRLSLADLDLNDGTAYEIVRAGPGVRQWVFDWAAAPSVHGEQPVSARMGNQVAPVAIRVKGSTKTQYDNRAKALVAAFSQLKFHLLITIDGTTEEWKCFAANMSPASSDGSGGDGSWDKFSLMAKWHQVYSCSVPRHPIPVSGVM
jgi:hypothetical protein